MVGHVARDEHEVGLLGQPVDLPDGVFELLVEDMVLLAV